MSHALTFAVTFATLYAAHQVGDHWVQAHSDALGKGTPGWPGAWRCARHVWTLTLAKFAMLGTAFLVLGVHPGILPTFAGLGVDAASHYWADRRFTLARLARLLWHGEFWVLGAPRPGRDDNPTLGTGAYALDQSWHIAWLWIAALIIAAA